MPFILIPRNLLWRFSSHSNIANCVFISRYGVVIEEHIRNFQQQPHNAFNRFSAMNRWTEMWCSCCPTGSSLGVTSLRTSLPSDCAFQKFICCLHPHGLFFWDFRCQNSFKPNNQMKWPQWQRCMAIANYLQE